MRDLAKFNLTIALAIFSGSAFGSNLKSSGHFGISIEDASSTGFHKSVGSSMFFDVSRSISSYVDVGFRSLGGDGVNENCRFYRLGVGPLISVQPVEGWFVQAVPFFFQETGHVIGEEDSYRSKGYGAMIGWERAMVLSPRVTFAWGGFITRHWGNITSYNSLDPAGTDQPKAQATWVGVNRNDGGSRGIELALRMRL